MALEGECDLSSKYFESVSLSVDLCESVPDQFKLIETPINSFLLVTNVMPTDTRPWSQHNSNGLDFSGIHLPRLKKLTALTNWETKEDKQKKECILNIPSDNIPQHYDVYDTWSWQRAFKINKDEIIQEAIAQLAKPENWQGVAVDDSLPLMWLLFYGKNSFCINQNCMFNTKFNHPGPILWPRFLYRPSENVMSFMAGVCRYVKFLYGCSFKREDILIKEIPFDISRFSESLENLKFIDDSGIYVSKTCLACKIYQQNLMSIGEASSQGSSIILGGSGKKYITSNTGTRRCLELGDIVLYPSYDINQILEDLNTDGIF